MFRIECLAQRIKQIFLEHNGNYGNPRIYTALRSTGHKINKKRVERLMRNVGLLGKAGRIYRRQVLAVAQEKTGISKARFSKEFMTGFMSGVLNPKNLLFYLSLFTVVLTTDVSLAFKVALGIWMTLVVFLWDTAIIFFLSSNKVRDKFTRLAYYIDKLTGAILGVVGFSIIKSALSR